MGQADHTQQVAESILRFFPGFEAFKLPPPSVSEEVMKNINRNKSQINSEFFSGIEKFKVLLKRTLTPKHSFNDGELVTGKCSVHDLRHRKRNLIHVIALNKVSVYHHMLRVRRTTILVYNPTVRSSFGFHLPWESNS